MHLKTILSGKDKKYYLMVMIAFILLVYVPEVIYRIIPTEEFIFNGGILNITDFNVYLSAIRQSSEGAWLFQPQFTPESFPPYFAFFPYMIAGKLMGLFGGGVILWFQVLKVTSLIWALNNLLGLLGTVFPDDDQLQKTAFFMLLLSNGLGWLIFPIMGGLTLITPDLFVPEWNLLNGAFASPHFLLGIAFQAAFFSGILNFFTKPGWWGAIPVAVAGIALSITYPYLIIVNGLVLATYLIYLSIQERKILWQHTIALGTACIPMIIALGYYGIYLPRDPLYTQLIVTNNDITPPPPLGMLVGFGLLFVLAAFGIRPWWRRQRLQIILFWLAINLVSIYLPFSFSGRLISSLFIPIILVAALAIEEVWLNWIKSRPQGDPARYRNLTLIFTLPSTFLFIIYLLNVFINFISFPYYNQQTELDAAAYLSEMTTDEDLLLAEFPLCNILPRYGNGRVFNGHFDLTVDMEGKFELVEEFWLPETSNQWRQDFIDTWGVTYIYQGRFENSHNDGEPLTLPYEIIYETEIDRIYRVP
jgi:hypothetical protein